MRFLAGTLADGVLVDAVLFLPRPPILPTKIKGLQKKYGN